jgi:hypothetical protein
MNTVPIFIGYDSGEIVAFHTLSHSIHKYSSDPVSITPIKLGELEHVYRRSPNKLHSTEFSLSRFLTPWLTGFNGWAIFMDCDMLCRTDIGELMDLRDPHYAVQVVKHDYTPKSDSKMLGKIQTKYDKKNWSSVMLMNCSRCFALTPEYVNSATGLELHQFKWLPSDELIGALPIEWNWLVGEYDYNPKAQLAHFTLGGPWWEDYFCCDYADEWRSTLEEATHAAKKHRTEAA